MMNRAEMWRIKDVAKYLNISSITIYRMLKKGIIPAHKIGSQWRFIKEEIDQWIRERG
jgi:excisionase family DNA binding protein